MRVTLLSTNLARGGAETQVVLLARALRARGHEVSVVSLLEPSAFREELAVHTLRMSPGRPDPLALAGLLALLRRLRPEVLHAHLFHANLAARLARLFCPVPALISTLHSLAESGRDSKNVARRDLAYRLTNQLSDATVAVSKAVAERHAQARAVSRRRLRVIPNGVDTRYFRPACDGAARQRLRENLGLGDGFVWLAAGRLMWKKDYPTLLRAFEGMPGTLLIAGGGPQEQELRALAQGDVRFLGERGDVADLLQAADAFVLSSVVEGLPMVLLEAAASGLPCVSTGVGGVREALPFAELAQPENPDDLRTAMRRTMELPAEERRRRGLEARAHVVAEFDIASVAARWEDLYRELLEP